MTDETHEQPEIESAVASCVRSEQALIVFVEGLTEVDPASPSRLPDWTVGHVMTHIARNGDSILSMFAGAPQYPHGREGRNADIEAGATRGWDELVADVASRSTAVVDAMTTRTEWSGTVEMITGERPTALVPLLRQREVEVHRADLGLGHEFAAMPADYIRRDLLLMGMLWTARQPMGMTALPDGALAADPATRLAWMMGRAEIDGLAPAGLF